MYIFLLPLLNPKKSSIIYNQKNIPIQGGYENTAANKQSNRIGENMINVLTSGESAQYIIVQVFVFLIVMLVSLPLHEYAHGAAAKLLGDDTAENSGRLTLNPLAHLDGMGTLAMLLFGIGWARPIPINPSKCTKVKPKAAMAITALAGPLTNLILGFISVVIMQFIFYANYDIITSEKESPELYLLYAAESVANINVYLAVFNLLPIPPFDGSRIFLSFLPTKLYFKVMKYERVIMGIIMILLLFGILSLPLRSLSNAIMGGMIDITGFVKNFFY